MILHPVGFVGRMRAAENLMKASKRDTNVWSEVIPYHQCSVSFWISLDTISSDKMTNLVLYVLAIRALWTGRKLKQFKRSLWFGNLAHLINIVKKGTDMKSRKQWNSKYLNWINLKIVRGVKPINDSHHLFCSCEFYSYIIFINVALTFINYKLHTCCFIHQSG